MSLDAYVSAMHARLVAVEGKLGLPSPNPPSLAAAPSGAGVTAFSEFYSDRVLAFVKSSATMTTLTTTLRPWPRAFLPLGL